MAERIVNGYKRIFEVRLLHHYWLDEGGVGAAYKDFTALTVSDQEKRLLSGYDIRSFFQIKPTGETEKSLKDLGFIFKMTALGFLVAAPATSVLPADAKFEFVVTVKSGEFFNYSAQTLVHRKIIAVQHGEITYRYKENVSVLTNRHGIARTLNGKTALLLSKEIPEAIANIDYPVESLVKNNLVLFRAVQENKTVPPSAAWLKMADNLNTLPIYAHQDDIPTTTDPTGLNIKGIELTDGIPDDIFALIRVETLDLVHTHGLKDANGLKSPVFEIHFLNRATVWKYFNKNTGATISGSSNPLPLTRFGNAGTKQKPSEGFVKPVFDKSNPPKITALVSEIFE